MTTIGYVRQIWLYPVKSMAGLCVDSAELYWYGLNGDRKYAFVRSEDRSGFPWLTARQTPTLLQYKPYLKQPDDPHHTDIVVETPEGKHVALENTWLQGRLAELYGKPVHLRKLSRGTFDCMPISLISTTTIRNLAVAAGRLVDTRRFRMNLVVETEATGPMPEEAWRGQRLAFADASSGALIELNYPTKRCRMVNLDPESAEDDPGILKSIAGKNNSCLGMYGSVSRPGTIRVNIPLILLPL